MRLASRVRRLTLFVAAFAAVVALDQVTKALARRFLTEDGSVTLLKGVMDLHLVFNQGAAFSMGEGFTWLFVAAALAISLGCALYTAFGRPSAPLATVLGIVAGGGIGNLIDRVALGCVTDFFMPTFVDFAVFNVADIAITCGFVVALVMFWREDAARERAMSASDGEQGEQKG